MPDPGAARHVGRDERGSPLRQVTGTATGRGSYDVAVIGAGPAGLTAARAAAAAGARTVCIDRYATPGGQYYRQPADASAGTVTQRRGRRLADAAWAAGAVHLPQTNVWSATSGFRLEAIGHPGRSVIDCRAVVVASGTHERVAAFPGWTLPGVFTAGGMQALLKGCDLAAGHRVVLAGTGPLLPVVAAALVRHGAQVVALLDANRLLRRAIRRPLRTVITLAGQPARIVEAARSSLSLALRGSHLRTGWAVTAAHGEAQVQAATIARLDANSRPVPGSARTVECDAIGIHFGLVPATGLYQLLGAALEHRPEFGGHVPLLSPTMQTSVPGVFGAGDGTGVGGADMAMLQGEVAGQAAAAYARGTGSGDSALARRKRRALGNAARFRALYGELFSMPDGLAEMSDGDTLICRCENVSRSDIERARARGAATSAAIKSLTRCAMGSCQGAMCGPVLDGLLAAEAPGEPPHQPQPLTARPPLQPIPVASLLDGAS